MPIDPFFTSKVKRPLRPKRKHRHRKCHPHVEVINAAKEFAEKMKQRKCWAIRYIVEGHGHKALTGFKPPRQKWDMTSEDRERLQQRIVSADVERAIQRNVQR